MSNLVSGEGFPLGRSKKKRGMVFCGGKEEIIRKVWRLKRIGPQYKECTTLFLCNGVLFDKNIYRETRLLKCYDIPMIYLI